MSVTRVNKIQAHDICQIDLIYFYPNVDYKFLFKKNRDRI